MIHYCLHTSRCHRFRSLCYGMKNRTDLSTDIEPLYANEFEQRSELRCRGRICASKLALFVYLNIWKKNYKLNCHKDWYNPSVWLWQKNFSWQKERRNPLALDQIHEKRPFAWTGRTILFIVVWNTRQSAIYEQSMSLHNYQDNWFVSFSQFFRRYCRRIDVQIHRRRHGENCRQWTGVICVHQRRQICKTIAQYE